MADDEKLKNTRLYSMGLCNWQAKIQSGGSDALRKGRHDFVIATFYVIDALLRKANVDHCDDRGIVQKKM